jgi:transposase
MYKALPRITESAEALQHRFRAEQDPQKRQRLQALYLLASGQATSRLAIAELLAVHRHTVRAWLATYEKGGLNMLLTLKKAPGKRSALTPAVLAQLQTRLRQPHGFGSYREIQQYLATDHSVHLAYSTVHGIVRYQLQAKPKAPRRSHPKKTWTQLPSFKAPSQLSS